MPRPEPRTTEISAPFWEAAAEGRLMLQECGDCSKRIFPPRIVCPACWSSTLVWRVASGKGTVHSMSVVHRAPNEQFADLAPYVVALVTLDEGPWMMTNIVACHPDEVVVGMRVEVTFPEEGFQLPLFRPNGTSG